MGYDLIENNLLNNDIELWFNYIAVNQILYYLK